MKKHKKTIKKAEGASSNGAEKEKNWEETAKRALADLENYRKQTEKRQQDLLHFANSGLLLDLLEIYDNFVLSLKFEDKNDSNFAQGVKHIVKQMEDMLKRAGVKKIETVGKEFDPTLHEAVEEKEEKGKKAGIIFEEIKGGYILNDKLLRPAMVKVAK